MMESGLVSTCITTLTLQVERAIGIRLLEGALFSRHRAEVYAQ